MDREQNEPWSKFRELAVQMLRTGQNSSQTDCELLFTIVCLPWFHNSICWQIYQQQEEDRYLATRSEWLMTEDINKFATPVTYLKYRFTKIAPTLLNDEIGISGSIIEEIVRLLQLSRYSWPQNVRQPIVTDGVGFELKINHGSVYLNLCWSCYGPDAWQSITQSTINIFNRLEENFNDITDN